MVGEGDDVSTSVRDLKEIDVNRLAQEICSLYSKIKRCSKDTSLTESYYLKHVETEEDRQERKLIEKLDPFIVLQYISSSIDVIINLKFEDIESKMIKKNLEDSKASIDMFNDLA